MTSWSSASNTLHGASFQPLCALLERVGTERDVPVKILRGTDGDECV
jgi:hypothetical protein